MGAAFAGPRVLNRQARFRAPDERDDWNGQSSPRRSHEAIRLSHCRTGADSAIPARRDRCNPRALVGPSGLSVKGRSGYGVDESISRTEQKARA